MEIDDYILQEQTKYRLEIYSFLKGKIGAGLFGKKLINSGMGGKVILLKINKGY